MRSLSIYVYKKFESRVLDNILAAPSYVEQLKNLGADAFKQSIFDNADWNKQNDTGQDWHVMGGIAAVSPSRIIEDKYTIKRCKTSNPSAGNEFIPIIEAPKLVTSYCSLTIAPKCLSANGSTITDLINLDGFIQ